LKDRIIGQNERAELKSRKRTQKGQKKNTERAKKEHRKGRKRREEFCRLLEKLKFLNFARAAGTSSDFARFTVAFEIFHLVASFFRD